MSYLGHNVIKNEFKSFLPFYVTKLGTIDLSSTSAEKCFFGDLAIWKLNFLLHLSIDLNFRHTSKKIKGGSPKKILEKKNVFPKKYVELRTFDGIFSVYCLTKTYLRPNSWAKSRQKSSPFPPCYSQSPQYSFDISISSN